MTVCWSLNKYAIPSMPAYCCARLRKRIDGRNETDGDVREVDAGYVLEEHGKASATSFR